MPTAVKGRFYLEDERSCGRGRHYCKGLAPWPRHQCVEWQLRHATSCFSHRRGLVSFLERDELKGRWTRCHGALQRPNHGPVGPADRTARPQKKIGTFALD